MSAHTPEKRKGRSANMSISQAKRADARARAALRLSEAQLKFMSAADPQYGGIQSWRATASTLRSLLARGLIEQRSVNYASGATQFFYLTDEGRFAVAQAIAAATGGAA